MGRGGRADGDRLVRHFNVERVLVGFGVDGDGPDAHAARRLDDAAGYFAAVGDQDFIEHRRPNRADRRLTLKQEITGQEDFLKLPYHQAIMNDKIPLSVGGGIGQARTYMALLRKAHLGEVTVSVWPKQLAGVSPSTRTSTSSSSSR